MAVRGSAARHVPGYPMAGLLQDVNRQARALQRRARTGPPSTKQPPLAEDEKPTPPAVAAAPAQPAASVVVTGADGRAHWRFPRPYTEPPVVAAIAVAASGGGGDGDGVITVMVEEVTAEHVTVRAWRTGRRGDAGTLPAEPAAPDVRVHLMAAPATLT